MEGSSKACRGGTNLLSADGGSLLLGNHGNPAMGRTHEMEFLSFRMQPRYSQQATLVGLRLDKIRR